VPLNANAFFPEIDSQLLFESLKNLGLINLVVTIEELVVAIKTTIAFDITCHSSVELVLDD
jgi:hypothetical protein